MAIIKKYSSFENLSNYKTFILDNNPNSEFFRISEFQETFTGGKNGFLIEGTPHLKETTELKIEVLDVDGNPMYYEPGSGIPEYYEGTSILVAVHVYDDTPIGIGQITILGELKSYETEDGIFQVPDEWKEVYNVKWQKKFKINKLLSNEDKVRFYKRPLISINEIAKPIFSISIPEVTQSGSLYGIPQKPTEGQKLENWTAGTSYLLHIDDATKWTGSVVGSTISIPDPKPYLKKSSLIPSSFIQSSLTRPIPYRPKIVEVLNESSIIVDIPYTINNIVQPFSSSNYEVTFQDTNSQILAGSALTGSFAEIKMSNLKTFVGDVARVKIFRKSRNEIGDYQFVQETKLESTELLRDLTTSTETTIAYGNFTEYNLNTYWVSSSNDHPISINTDKLLNSIKIDYNTGVGGIQRLETAATMSISQDVEYTIEFKTLLSGSVDSSKYIKAYFSSSDYMQDIVEISAASNYKQRTVVTENIIANTSSLANLVIEVSGDDWYISNVSLRNAQETSFSPDEFVLIQDVPRKLPAETFDYRFEFYDINNNYIPVDVFATKEFNGGNIINGTAEQPAFTFSAATPFFRFVSGSIGNPVNQSVPFLVTRTIYTGSVTYASSALDTDGNYIDPSSYIGAYPGKLTNANNFGATLFIGDFTGSDSNYTIGTMIYTASLATDSDPIIRYQRIDRVVEGLSTSELFATANTNQFYYLASNLSGSPETQEIRINVKRKNLNSIIASITATSSSGAPPLTEVSDVNGTKTYKIEVSDFPYETGEVTYAFTGSDQFGLLYSDSTLITPIINYSAISVTVTNSGTAFQASSDGLVDSLEYDLGDGEVSVIIGEDEIPFSHGLVTVNTFDIESVTQTNIGLSPNEFFPTTNSYGVSSMSSDSGQLIIIIRYKDGSGSIKRFKKKVNYSKIRASKPTANVAITPQAQVVSATAAGTLTGTPENPILTIVEGSDPYNYAQNPTLSNGQYKITNVTGVDVFSTTPNSNEIDLDYNGLDNYDTLTDTNFGNVSYEYRTDGGSLVTGSIIFSIAKSKDGNGATVVLPDGLISGSDQLTSSLDDTYVSLLTNQTISGSKTFDTGTTLPRIIVQNGNDTTGIVVENDNAGRGISIDNNDTGQGIFIRNIGAGTGLLLDNSGSAGNTGIVLNHYDDLSNGMHINNYSSGSGLLITNHTIIGDDDTAGVSVIHPNVGSRKAFRSEYQGFEVFSVNAKGAVSAWKYIVDGKTNDDILLGDGTTKSASLITGSADTGNWTFSGDILSGGGISLNANTNYITATTLSVSNIVGTIFSNLKSTNGYQKLGGGTLIQWGYSNSLTVIFPIAFTFACTYVGVTTDRTTPGNSGYNHANTVTTTGFVAVPDGPFWWMAIGY
jgi:hypothetical protein